MASGSMRESMQVTMATPAWAMPSKPPRSKVSAYAALAASRSSKSSVASRVQPDGAAMPVERRGSSAVAEQHQGEHRRDQRADGGADEHRVLLGDAGLLQQVVELVAPGGRAAADLERRRQVACSA